jgi:hypothetical protein
MMVFMVGMKQQLTDYKIVFMFIGWGLPGIGLVIALAMEKIGAYAGSTMCLLNDSNNFAWQYGLFCIFAKFS